MPDYEADPPAQKPNRRHDDEIPVSKACGASIKRVLDAILDKQAMTPPRDLVYFEINGNKAHLYYKPRR